MGVGGRLVLVAEIDGVVIGCLSTSVTRSLRSRGIGAELVRAAEETLAAEGCYTVEITSQVRHTEAHCFYERLGYERTSVRLAKEL